VAVSQSLNKNSLMQRHSTVFFVVEFINCWFAINRKKKEIYKRKFVFLFGSQFSIV